MMLPTQLPCRFLAAFSVAAALASARSGSEDGNQAFMPKSVVTSVGAEEGYDYQKYLTGSQEGRGDFTNYMSGLQGQWMPAIHNTSDQQEWADAFKNKFVSQWVPEVQNMSNQTEVSEAFKHKYADQWVPEVQNMSNQTEVSEAFKHKYADQWIPEVQNMSNQTEVSEAFKHKYADQWTSHVTSNGGQSDAPWQQWVNQWVSGGRPKRDDSEEKVHLESAPVIAMVAAPDGSETAQDHFDRVHTEAFQTLQMLRDLAHQVSAVSVDEHVVQQHMQASLTDEETSITSNWHNQSLEFDALHQHMRDAGANWSQDEMHDAVQQATDLDERLRNSEWELRGLASKCARAVTDSIWARVRSDENRANELAMLAGQQSVELESAARELHSRSREKAARDVDDRARSLERDVEKAAEKLARHVESQARLIENALRKSYSEASERRGAMLHRDIQAEAAMGAHEGGGSSSLAEASGVSTGTGAGSRYLAAAVMAAALLYLVLLARGRKRRAALQTVDAEVDGDVVAGGAAYVLQA